MKRGVVFIVLALGCSTAAPGGAGGGGSGGGSATGGGSGGGDPADAGPIDAGNMDAGAVDAGPINVHIQDIQDGTVPRGAQATVTGEFVTGMLMNVGGSYDLFIQEASGRTTPGHTYPEFAGMGVQLSRAEAAQFPDVQTLAQDACVTVTGTVSESASDPAQDVGTTQLSLITAFTKVSGCGDAPVAAGVSFSDIATDTDTATAGNQPGPKAERYEGVLVTISSVLAVTAVSAPRFNVSPAVQTSTMEIDSFLMGGTSFSYAAGTSFSTITGVYSQANRGMQNSLVVYHLTPRNAADLVTP
jgi:hypothetical protein